MSRILAIVFVVMFALSSAVGYSAHASDFSGISQAQAQSQAPADVSAVSAVAVADGDRSNFDTGSDPSKSHHHTTCQGHHVAQPSLRSHLNDELWHRAAGPRIANTPAPPSAILEPDHRPPKA